MENLNNLNDLLTNATKKCVSVDTTISGPHEASNGKMYMKAKFKIDTRDDDGFIGQSKLYTKVFFEDSHSLLYITAQEALDNNTTLKILAGRLTIPCKAHYILDAEGNRQKKANGDFRISKSIVLFLIGDENPRTMYDAQCDQITAKDAWVAEPTADDETDAEEIKAADTKKKK
jgi:hypothetical protein